MWNIENFKKRMNKLAVLPKKAETVAERAHDLLVWCCKFGQLARRSVSCRKPRVSFGILDRNRHYFLLPLVNIDLLVLWFFKWILFVLWAARDLDTRTITTNPNPSWPISWTSSIYRWAVFSHLSSSMSYYCLLFI